MTVPIRISSTALCFRNLFFGIEPLHLYLELGCGLHSNVQPFAKKQKVRVRLQALLSLSKAEIFSNKTKMSMNSLNKPFMDIFLELMTRLELVTSSLPRMCATTCATSAYLAGAEGFEPSARGFGDHCSTG